MQQEAPQAPRVYELLAEAVDELKRSRQSLFRTEPDYPTSIASSLRAFRRALEAVLTWHSVPVPDNAPLHMLTRQANSLAPSLAPFEALALPLEPLADEVLTDGDCASTREAIRRGYYAARNAFYTVLRSLPPGLQPTMAGPR